MDDAQQTQGSKDSETAHAIVRAWAREWRIAMTPHTETSFALAIAAALRQARDAGLEDAASVAGDVGNKTYETEAGRRTARHIAAAIRALKEDKA